LYDIKYLNVRPHRNKIGTSALKRKEERLEKMEKDLD